MGHPYSFVGLSNYLSQTLKPGNGVLNLTNNGPNYNNRNWPIFPTYVDQDNMAAEKFVYKIDPFNPDQTDPTPDLHHSSFNLHRPIIFSNNGNCYLRQLSKESPNTEVIPPIMEQDEGGNGNADIVDADNLSPNPSNLNICDSTHLRRIKNQRKKVFACPILTCKLLFNRARDLKAHRNMHLNLRPQTTAMVCSNKDANLDLTHNNNLANKVQKHFSPKEKPMRIANQNHKSNQTSNPETQRRSYRRRKLHPDIANMSQVEQTEYFSIKMFECPQCDKRFSSVHGMDYHVNAHLGIRYKCGNCPKDFASSSYTKKHEKRCNQTTVPLLLEN